MRNAFSSVLCLLLLCVGVVVAPAQILEVPVDPVEPGEFVTIPVSGLTDTEISRAVLDWEPHDGVQVIPVKTWGGQAMIFFKAPSQAASKYALILAWPLSATEVGYEKAYVVVEGENGPDPQPDPEPDPDPEPGPLAKMSLIVVEETRDRTPQQAQILLDPTLRTWLKNNGHQIHLIDKDQPAEGLKDWIALTDNVLPHLFIVDSGGGKPVWDGPLPTTQEAMRELCKEWGAEK